MSVDFNMMCLDVTFKIGDLRVEGEYEATNMTLQRLLPITNNGKIEVTFKDVSAKGRIGLLIRGDSLVPENYDISYEATETSLSVKYFISSENEVENKVVKQNGDDFIGNTIKVQLTTILTNMLHRQLAEAVTQFSVTELMKDEVAQLCGLAREHSSRANKLLDSLLCTAKDFLVERNFRSIETPPFNVVYRGKLSALSQGTMRTGSGYIQDLSTLSRLQDLSLFEDPQKLVVYGSLTLREMKHGYEHYSSQFEETGISGSIRTTVYENRISIKLYVHKEGEYCKTQLENVQVNTVKDIDVDTSGLASLSWLVPKVESWVIGNIRYKALPVLERYIREAFEFAIAKTDCVALLFD
ncbi:hypothetical protein JTB14_018502 [Gonioctena quinquepunctata]|nr:hypothetical protein JTB14_018502 [Gonioctena quinquepunctata]